MSRLSFPAAAPDTFPPAEGELDLHTSSQCLSSVFLILILLLGSFAVRFPSDSRCAALILAFIGSWYGVGSHLTSYFIIFKSLLEYS